MTLSQFNIIELSTASATILGAIAMLLAQTQKSKCKKCMFCFGCLSCDREVQPDIENQLEDVNPENNGQTESEQPQPKDDKNILPRTLVATKIPPNLRKE
jgi:hypothetical protein